MGTSIASAVGSSAGVGAVGGEGISGGTQDATGAASGVGTATGVGVALVLTPTDVDRVVYALDERRIVSVAALDQAVLVLADDRVVEPAEDAA